MNAKKDISLLLAQAGISVNGNNARDIEVHNESFYKKVMTTGSLGLGESYMDKWWDARHLDDFFYHVLSANLESRLRTDWKMIADTLFFRIVNRQTSNRSMRVGGKHYNLGNTLFTKMLDKRMVYSCGYWRNASNLDEAQTAKLDLICQKLNLQPGMHVLDIGCGWGSFGKFAAEKYGVKVTGITVSSQQANLAKALCSGLPVEIKLMDYRHLTGQFDHIVSIGMFEHVGYKNYPHYMRVVQSCLKEDGLFLLHTIGGNTSETSIDSWINTYIFPDAMLPSIQQIGHATESRFVMEDWQNFSADYDKTLMAWHDNFTKNWDELKHEYDERFYRMWTYYLLMCAGSFRSRKNQVWQIVFSKKGVQGGYTSVR